MAIVILQRTISISRVNDIFQSAREGEKKEIRPVAKIHIKQKKKRKMLSFGIDIYQVESIMRTRSFFCGSWFYWMPFVSRNQSCFAFIITLGEEKATTTYLYQNSFSI